MRWWLGLLIAIACAAAFPAQGVEGQGVEGQGVEAQRVQVPAQGDDREPQAEAPLRFESVDVLIDPSGGTLAAWQVRVIDPSGRAAIVGVEGGEHASFAGAPYHDPRALTERTPALVVAAFDTTGTGPSGPTRVARLHFAVTGGDPVNYEATLEVAASPDGPLPGAVLELVR